MTEVVPAAELDHAVDQLIAEMLTVPTPNSGAKNSGTAACSFTTSALAESGPHDTPVLSRHLSRG